MVVERATHDAIIRAAELLRSGGLVVFPTETVYGLGANALDKDAVRRVFAAKGRPANNPLIVHVADSSLVQSVAAHWPPVAARLAERFWPGPLTLVLPKRPAVSAEVTGGGPTIAVRVPDHPVALALLRAAGVPVAAPSANRTTELSPTAAEHVADGLADLILDGGSCAGGIESTVLDVTADPPRILRPGLLTAAQVESVIGPVIVVDRPMDHVPRSPGQMDRHYAPRTPTELALGDGRSRVEELERAGLRVGWLTWEGAGGRESMPREPVAYAAKLYAALHRLDACGFDRIVVAEPPDTPEWFAVRDRLRRAAG